MLISVTEFLPPKNKTVQKCTFARLPQLSNLHKIIIMYSCRTKIFFLEIRQNFSAKRLRQVYRKPFLVISPQILVMYTYTNCVYPQDHRNIYLFIFLSLSILH